MTRIATLLSTTALAATAGAWMAWAPLAGAEAQIEPPRPAVAEASDAVADLVEHTSPAVVTVLATQEGPEAPEMGPMDSPFGPGSPFEEFFRRFGMPEGAIPMPPNQGGPGQSDRVALGSGFVMEKDGYIVTNNHVVDNAEKVKVRLSDDREFDAEVIGTDKQTDLALIKIDADDLPVLELGDSDHVRVGEDVIAVGNPFGLGGTVTRGIVSAMARDISAGPYVDFIQTDAAINRGNSGGPLLDLDGKVIGVNSAIYSPNGGSVGVGFAIPSNTVRNVVAQLKDGGEVERGWLGVQIQNVTPEIAAAIGLDEPQGALVADVVPESPAARNLEVGDVILTFDGKKVASSRELPKLVAAASPDKEVELGILRKGEEQAVSFRLGKFDETRMASAETGETPSKASSDRLGATLAPITPTARQELGLDDEVSGVVITSLDGKGRAADAGLEVGDVILSVGHTPVQTPGDVEKALHAAKTDAVLMQIDRHGAKIFVGVKLA
ncbi:DegQ family serine endoprotease [Amaricoccus sp.]|uniref:DegQ family serine endoprotease n=1 Tax=Amaricoccus sp. TaxID=1872485 RepID=UPI00262BD787|nr:DegQ family serine endoprotease [Amaricoccus sp.]HRO09883.1 DegQ family serine endoprotease [Amaricoccus sp.]